MPNVVRFIETESSGGCQGLREEKCGEFVFGGYRVSFEEDGKVLEMDGGDGYTV